MLALGSKLVFPDPEQQAVQSQPAGSLESWVTPEGRGQGEAERGAGDSGETVSIRDSINFIFSRVKQLWRPFLPKLLLPTLD